MTEIVYVMTNDAMPGMVKIGMTNDEISKRQRSLSSHSGVPLPFTVHYAAEVDSAKFVEEQLHKTFAGRRVNSNREFFRVGPEEVVAAIQLAKPKNVTPSGQTYENPEEERAVKKAAKKRSRLKMDNIGIPIGSELVFTRDESIKARVVEGNKVEFENQITSLSASAGILLKRLGWKSYVNGADFWKFDDETLAERRFRMEEEELGEED